MSSSLVVSSKKNLWLESDPRLRLLLLFFNLLILFVWRSWYSLAALLMNLLFIFLLGQFKLKNLWKSLRFIFGFAFFCALFQLFQSNYAEALFMFCRLSLIFICSLLLSLSLAPQELSLAARNLGLSDAHSMSLEIALRFIPTLKEITWQTWQAQQARGLAWPPPQKNLFVAIKTLYPILISVLIQSILQAEQMIEAMDLRAYAAYPERSWYHILHWKKTDSFLGLFFLLLWSGVLILFKVGGV